jgi:outer membrane protein TolC
MDAVVRAVLHHNDRVAAARYMEKAAIDKIGPAGAWDDPMLMLGVSNLPTSLDFAEEDMTMKMIGLSQKIPYAGQKGLDAKAARSQAVAAGAETNQAELELATAGRNAFINLYYRQKALDLISGQRELQKNIIASVIAKLSTDQANQSDVSAAQANLWRLEADILSNQQEIDAAYNELYALMGEEAPQSLPQLNEPDFGNTPESVDKWLESVKENYPPLKKAKSQAVSAGYSAAAAGRMRWPMLELLASYGIRENGPYDPMSGDVMKRKNMINFQANISLPFFSGRQQGKMAASMKAMQLGSEAEANQILRDATATLKVLFSQSQRFSQSLKLYRDRIIPADEDAYRSALAAYTANRIPFISVLDYGMNIYRDRMTANQMAFQLTQTLVQAAKYTSNPDQWK